jgi:cystathionine gamma-synthase
MTRKSGTSTTAIHGGLPEPRPMNSVNTPVVFASTFPFQTFAQAQAVVERSDDREDYARYAHPTVRAAEKVLAALDGGQDAVLFASGMAALTAVMMTFLQADRHVVLLTQCYRPTEQLVTDTFARFGVRHTLVAADDTDALQAAIEPDATRLVLMEWPTNPHIRVADLKAIAAICKPYRQLRLVVDATLSGPATARPLELGADIVVHSATKYLSGHNDMLAGAVVGRAGWMELVRDTRSRTGATLDPHSAFLLARGLKTLAPRMALHHSNALSVAQFLDTHPLVERVWYPLLPSHPDHARALDLMPAGAGGLMSFEVRGGLPEVRRFCDATRLVQLAASLGGVESLMHPPALFSYWDMAPDARSARGIGDNLIRISVGLEDVQDLIADLDQALAAMNAEPGA